MPHHTKRPATGIIVFITSCGFCSAATILPMSQAGFDFFNIVTLPVPRR